MIGFIVDFIRDKNKIDRVYVKNHFLRSSINYYFLMTLTTLLGIVFALPIMNTLL